MYHKENKDVRLEKTVDIRSYTVSRSLRMIEKDILHGLISDLIIAIMKPTTLNKKDIFFYTKQKGVIQ